MKKVLSVVFVVIFCFSFFAQTSYAQAANSNKITTTTPTTSALGFDVTALGAKGNDTIDDTAAIQNALNQYDKVYIPSGTYMINVEKALKVKSNQTITLDSGAVLQALPAASGYSAIIRVASVSNVVITGGKIIGERNSHLGTSGEWGMGISVEAGSNNVSISNMTISNCWGDGLYVGGGSTPSTNIEIDKVVSDNNRRQGLSITNAVGVTVSNSIFKNTNGTLPQAGIDIEPNKGSITSDITITNTQCYGNEGKGLLVTGLVEKIQRVTVINSTFNNNIEQGIYVYNSSTLNFTLCTASNNKKQGVYILNANDVSVTGGTSSNNEGEGVYIHNSQELTFSGTTIENNYSGIDIPRDVSNAKFTNMKISGNKYRGVSMVSTRQKLGLENISFDGCYFYNNSQEKINNTDGVRVDNADSTGYIKDVTFNDCKFYDDQTVKTQRYGMTVGFSAKMSNIVVGKECDFSGNISGNLLGGSALV